MTTERILPFTMATKLTETEVSAISASGMGSGGGTLEVTFTVNSGNDCVVDGRVDG